MQNETVDVIIPIYNNIDIINNILKKLSELYEYNIIVIDDCSIDGTYELINRFLKKKKKFCSVPS